MSDRHAAVAVADVATVNSRAVSHSCHPSTGDIPNPMAGFSL